MPTTEIQLKRGNLARWATVNPVLKLAELGFEKDTKKLKIGDGVTPWNALPYLSLGSVISGNLYFVDEAALIAARDPESEDRYPGEFAFVQGAEFPTIWTWDPVSEEWADTGNPVNFTVDQEVIPGSQNALASYIIISLLEGKLNTDGIITQSQVTGLIDALASKLTATDFLTYLVNNTDQGSGITLSIVGGKLRISASGTGAEAGDFISIGGLPLDNLALAAEFAKYQKTPVWTTVTPVDGVVTLPAVNGTNDYYEYTESGPVTLAHTGTFEDAGHKWVRVTLGSSSHTITLGAGYTDKEGVAQTEIVLTGTAGRVKEFYLVRKGSTWIVYEDAGSGDAINLPIDISDVTGLQAELDDLQTQIDGLSGGGGPAVSETYADIAARDADAANRTAGEIVKVTDASADTTVDTGYAYYEFEGGTTWRKLSEEESMDLGVGNDGGTVDDFNPAIVLTADFDWNDYVQTGEIAFTKGAGTFKSLKCGRVKIVANGDGVTWSEDFINNSDFSNSSLPALGEVGSYHIFFMWSQALGKILVNVPANTDGTIGGPVTGAPNAPTGLIATAVSGGITLNWTTPSNDGGSAITHYEIQRESPAGGGFTTLVANTGGTGTTYSDTSVTGGTQYNYKVRAYNANGAGSFSNEANATASTTITGTFDFQPQNLVNINAISDTEIQKTSNTAAYDAFCNAIYRVKSGSARVRFKVDQLASYGRIGFNQTGTTSTMESHVFLSNNVLRLVINTTNTGSPAPTITGSNLSRLYEIHMASGGLTTFRYSDDEGNAWTDIASGTITSQTYPYDIDIVMYNYLHEFSNLVIIGDDFELDPR